MKKIFSILPIVLICGCSSVPPKQVKPVSTQEIKQKELPQKTFTDLTIAWDKSPDNVSYYEVFYGPIGESQHSVAVRETTATLTLEKHKTYLIYVKSVDSEGLHSQQSMSMTYTAQ